MSILGIEFSKDSIKIVEVNYARRMKILNFAIIDSGAIPPERRLEQLEHVLQARGFEAKEAIVAFSGPGVEHRLLTLPPLSAREMQFVMAREAKKVMASREMLWTYESVNAKEELGIKKQQILLVTAEPDTVRTIQENLSPARVKVVQVTTVAESLVNLLANIGVWKRDVVKSVVHFTGNRVYMLFVREGALLLSRDIPYDPGDLSQDDQIARLMTELKRSSMFFRQNFPQAKFDEFLFSGDHKLMGAIAAAAKQEFGVEAGMLRFEDSIDTSGLRGDWDTLRFNLPLLSVAIGTAWRKVPGAGINLIPNSKPASKTTAQFARIARFVTPIAIVALLLGGSYYYAAKSKIDATRLELTRKSAELQPILDRGAQQQALSERNAFIQQLTKTTDWTEMLRSLTYIVPETAVFDELQIDRQGKPAVIIRGSVVATNNYRVTADFNSFMDGLKRIPQFAGVSLNGAPKVANDGPQSRIVFEVRCELN